jgi:hypothetical protein
MNVSPGTPLAGVLREILRGAVDYAGLFPPASLDLPSAARNFAEYRNGPDAWALGRFILPVARLDELAAVAGPLFPEPNDAPWRLAVLAGTPDEDGERITAFNASYGYSCFVEAAEARGESAEQVAGLAPLRAVVAELFVEVPARGGSLALLAAVQGLGAAAKIRTGGVTPDAFPAAHDLAHFLEECAALALPFKATAGLHHPLRAEYALTYANDAPRGTMFGYVNVVLAAALARRRSPHDTVVRALEERDPASLVVTSDALSWRGEVVTAHELQETRTRFVRGFGSCSFREPLDEIAGLAPAPGGGSHGG